MPSKKWVCLFACLALGMSVGGYDAAAQAGGEAVRWFVNDGRAQRALKPAPGWHPDSLALVAGAVIDALQRDGHYQARVDSIRAFPGAAPVVVVYAHPGPAPRIAEVRISGARVMTAETLRALMKTRPGRTLNAETLESDIDALLVAYTERGYGLAAVSVARIELGATAQDGLIVELQVDEGEPVTVAAVELVGAARTRRAYVERLTGLRAGDVLARDLDEVRLRLEETGFFARVERPVLYRLPSGAIALRMVVEEASPGVFDLVLGYQPPAGSARSQGLVGNGHLELRNLFGGGRVMALHLNRLPGQISRLEASFRDPYVAGWPLQLEMTFLGLQQDSTYATQRYLGAMGYRVAPGLDVLLTVSREVTRPGFAGAQLVGGQQRIARSDAVFAGATVRYRRVDRLTNPRRGLAAETRFERGNKERVAFSSLGVADTTSVTALVRQERLAMQARLYVPTLARQVFVLGGEANAVIGKVLDESDLLRFGGAASLRGYEEDRFRGQFVQRSFAEYRYQFERDSYAYLFFDLGYVDRPATATSARQRDVYPGYGFGFQFGTSVGLINTSFALSPDDAPTEAKVHVGISVGL
ncbi:MAG: POTRA domain-containing protein [Rhodothermales bacterium]